MEKARLSHTYVDVLSMDEDIHGDSRITYLSVGPRPESLGQSTGN